MGTAMRLALTHALCFYVHTLAIFLFLSLSDIFTPFTNVQLLFKEYI